jgi:sulfotransferase family protein
LPIFRLSRAFGVGRGAKVFFNLQGGLTRGAVPDLEEQAEKLRKARTRNREQAEKLRKARTRNREQAEKLRKARTRNQEQTRKLREQAEKLRKALIRNKRQRKMARQRKLEISQLRNELRAVKERAEGTPNDLPAPQATGEPEMGALPDFVIIGAHKGGTTSLYHLLTQHPYVERAPVKELHFFDLPERFEKGIEWYRRCFPPPRWKDGRRTITGEATPYYLYYPHVADRMAEVIPQARLIALLRNPVDRAYSHYYMRRRLGHETGTFEEAVEAEKAWLLHREKEPSEHERYSSASDDSSNLLARGIYVDQLLRWSRFFDAGQMLVLKSEDFFERPADIVKRVLDFLGLPEWEPPAWEIRNKGNYEQKLDPATRRWLEEFFEPHNRRLYEYLGVDFGW